MKRTRVKICGITRLEDAISAARLGADALGFVFVPASRRNIAPDKARCIVEQLPPFVEVVGLFLDAKPEAIEAALEAVPSLLPQFHGRESATDCERWERPYLKAIGLGQKSTVERLSEEAELRSIAEQLAAHRKACGFLFDSNAPGQLGGTGHVFDWQKLDRTVGRNLPGSLILAGGLGVHNVSQAIRQVAPWAVDVSSGVEKDKGIKDLQKMKTFIEAVRAADRHIEEKP
ncbi:MAG: phosphoribosylanthranilate isomerase [Granulosicoccus sp.]